MLGFEAIELLAFEDFMTLWDRRATRVGESDLLFSMDDLIR
jgi:hypothetical protein